LFQVFSYGRGFEFIHPNHTGPFSTVWNFFCLGTTRYGARLNEKLTSQWEHLNHGQRSKEYDTLRGRPKRSSRKEFRINSTVEWKQTFQRPLALRVEKSISEVTKS
jgi:hypothetical protein